MFDLNPKRDRTKSGEKIQLQQNDANCLKQNQREWFDFAFNNLSYFVGVNRDTFRRDRLECSIPSICESLTPFKVVQKGEFMSLFC